MRSAFYLFVVFSVSACAVDHPTFEPADVGSDQPILEDVGPDAAPDIGNPDGRPFPDSGPDTGDSGPDSGLPDAGDAGPDAGDAGPDAGDDAGCSFAPRCDGNRFVRCVDGVPDETACDDATCQVVDGLGCFDFEPSNVSRLAYAPVGDETKVFSGVTHWDTSECDTLPYHNSDHSTATLCVLSFDAVRFEGTHHITGDRPLLILAARTLEIAGIFHADGNAGLPGPGGGTGGVGASAAEPAPQGGATGTTVAPFAHGGGGGGGGGAAGGPGGTGGTAVGGLGGEAFADDLFLVPLRGGGGGGGARGRGGDGGGGGGALQFSARGRLTFSGVVNIAGGAGEPGESASSPDHGGDGGGGGGGGAGGSLLLESGVEVALSGTVFAAGGGGASSATCSVDGEPGGEEYESDNVTGGPEPTCFCRPGRPSQCRSSGGRRVNFAADGGDGGLLGDGQPGNDDDDPEANGGGGGGAGLIVVRAPTPSLTDRNGTGVWRRLPASMVRVSP